MPGLKPRPIVELDAKKRILNEWPSICACARALGVQAPQVYTSTKNGWKTRGRKLAFKDDIW